MKIIIACDPEEGKSTEVSLYLKDQAERMNRRVVMLNVRDLRRSLNSFDVLIVVGEIDKDDLCKPMLDFITRNLTELNSFPSFFIPVLPCEDENDLKVSDTQNDMLRTVMEKTKWKPQQVFLAAVGIILQHNQFITIANWPELKISLQRFLICNDLMMAT
jgi:menaquinone-dependent protoporphyrinogen IX oxidase